MARAEVRAALTPTHFEGSAVYGGISLESYVELSIILM